MTATKDVVVPMKEYMENGMKFENPEYLIVGPIGYDEVVDLHYIKRSG